MRSARGSTGWWIGWPKPGILLAAARGSRAAIASTASPGSAPLVDALAGIDEHGAAELGGAEDDAAGAEDAGGDGGLQRFGGGVVSHARRDRRRRQAVLGDGDEEEVEEIALVRRSARGRSSRRKK